MGSRYKKYASDRVEEQNKNRVRPRSGRKFWGFEVQNVVSEALGGVKGSEKRKIFARLRRGLLLNRHVVFLYWNPKIEIANFWIFISVGGGGGGLGTKKNRDRILKGSVPVV